MARMRLAIELYSTTEEDASRIAGIIKEATGLSVRMFEVDNEGRRVEELEDIESKLGRLGVTL